MRTTLQCLAILGVAMATLPTAVAQESETPARGLGEAVGRPPAAVENVSPPAANDSESEAKPLTLEQKIAQLFIVTLGGAYRPNPTDRLLFRELPPGGVIVPSVARPLHAAEYIAGLRGIEQTTGRPMFIAANVYALTQHDLLADKTFMELPSMLATVAAADPALTANLAERIAGHLRMMGFNMHLGPSLALASTLSETDGNVHNFGSDPAKVAQTGNAFFHAFREAGLVTVATGFPGGETNRVDGSRAVLVTPAQQLEERELVPYARAIEAGVDIVQVGNTVCPTLDKAMRPASQSPLVIEGLLRFRLEFDGVVLAGPVDSRDLNGDQSPGEAALASFRAGADMVYMLAAGRSAIKAVTHVAKAVRDGVLPERVIDEAYERVSALKTKHKLAEKPKPDEGAVKGMEKDIASYDETYWIERQAITLVQNRGNILPLSKDKSQPIGVTGVVGVEELHDELEEYIKKIAHQRIASARHARRLPTFEIDRITKYARGMKTAVVVLTSELPTPGQARLITALQEAGARVVVVLLGYPSHIEEFAHADAIVCAYSGGVKVAETMRAVADILAGNAPIAVLPALREVKRPVNEPIPFDVRDVIRSPVGRLPVSVGTRYEAGTGLTYDPGDTIERVQWDFGDGARSKKHSDTHTYTAPGAYTVTLTVTDGRGRESQGTFKLIVE